MKRRVLSLSLTAGLLAAPALAISACSAQPAQPRTCPTSPVATGLAVAVGDRSDSPQPSWPAQLDSQLTRIVNLTQQQADHHLTPTAGVTFVRVDGRPSVGCVMSYDSSGANGPARQANADAFLSAVHSEVGRLAATSPQADPLTALSQAAAAAGSGGTVVLMDSGLQTVAPLNFTQADLLDADPVGLVAQLRSAGELPDLDGRTVILDGIGYTAVPQVPLDQDQRDHLVELWRQIALASGASKVQIIATPDTQPSGSTDLAVTSVRVPAPDNVHLGCDQQSILADDGAVGFLPNKTTFRDNSAARTVLGRFASWLHANPGAHAALTGSIAHYGADDQHGLSLARAQRIGSVLVDLGAAPSQVTASGAGWGPCPTKTAPHASTSDPLNRRVVVQLSCG